MLRPRTTQGSIATILFLLVIAGTAIHLGGGFSSRVRTCEVLQAIEAARIKQQGLFGKQPTGSEPAVCLAEDGGLIKTTISIWGD